MAKANWFRLLRWRRPGGGGRVQFSGGKAPKGRRRERPSVCAAGAVETDPACGKGRPFERPDKRCLGGRLLLERGLASQPAHFIPIGPSVGYSRDFTSQDEHSELERNLGKSP